MSVPPGTPVFHVTRAQDTSSSERRFGYEAPCGVLLLCTYTSRTCEHFFLVARISRLCREVGSFACFLAAATCTVTLDGALLQAGDALTVGWQQFRREAFRGLLGRAVGICANLV